MAIQVQGYTGTTAEVESNSRAQRVVPYPLDDGALMTGSMGLLTGVMVAGIASASEIFQFRWTHATNLAAIKRVRLSAGNTATAFAAGVVTFDAIIARSFTVAGTGGGTATITGNNNKLRTSMATTALGEARIATTAALTAGTKTLDSQAIGSVSTSITAVAGTVLVLPGTELWAAMPGEYPVILAQNEGLIVRCTVPATGTWTASVSIDWVEVSAYAP